jgi:hypothetical protein
MLAITFTLSLKHAGIALASVCGLILLIIFREELWEFITDCCGYVAENTCERLPVMGIELLLFGVIYGIVLAFGAPLAFGSSVIAII